MTSTTRKRPEGHNRRSLLEERAAFMPRGSLIAALAVILILSGCGSSLKARVESALETVSASMDSLGQQLDAGKLANASLLVLYADKLSVSKPEFRNVAALMKKEGTRHGMLYASLATRAKEVRAAALESGGASKQNYKALAAEINSLYAAADPLEFNRALADPVNVLADLSEGELARVDSVSAAAAKTANQAGDFGPGSQLVGNPSYGQWRTNSGGSSFWIWYGQYALFRTLVGGPAIGYGHWSSRRDYSYYNDYGRQNYTSPRAKTRQARVESSTRRKFASQGKSFRSPYARQRTGASANVARRKFASSRQRPSAQSSMRGWGGGGSRGPRRGK